MKFLLDENISHTLAKDLQAEGYVAKHVLAVGLGSTPDETILAYARNYKFTIITHDKDFANLIRLPIQKHSGVILLRFKNQRPSNVSASLRSFLKVRSRLANRLVVLQEDGAKIS